MLFRVIPDDSYTRIRNIILLIFFVVILILILLLFHFACFSYSFLLPQPFYELTHNRIFDVGPPPAPLDAHPSLAT